MNDFSKETAISHLKENWNNVGNRVGCLGRNKIYDFYDRVLPKHEIKIFYQNLNLFHLCQKFTQQKTK